MSTDTSVASLRVVSCRRARSVDLVAADDVCANYDSRQVRTELGRSAGRACRAARLKHESDVGAANIPAWLEPLDAAVGHVALALNVAAPMRVCSVSQFRSALVDDSQTSGARCPGQPGIFRRSPDRPNLVLSRGKSNAGAGDLGYALDLKVSGKLDYVKIHFRRSVICTR